LATFCQREVNFPSYVDGLFTLIDGSSDCDIFHTWNDGNEVTNIYFGNREDAFMNAGYVMMYIIEGLEVMSACNMTGN
jgi:FAD/FMN-containing dehydrogenase